MPVIGQKSRKRAQKEAKKRGTSVFVVHGRDEKIRKSLFAFLRAIGLSPIEWRKAIEYTGKPSPYVGEILDVAFKRATAVVVLLTPDDEARLKEEFFRPSDAPGERGLRGQPRLNVLFEAGMAFGRNPDNTVLIQVGDLRPFSDIAGRHVVRLDNSAEKRQELVTKLKNCGCLVEEGGSDWLGEGDFQMPSVKHTSPKRPGAKGRSIPSLESNEVLRTVLHIDQSELHSEVSKSFERGTKIHVSASSKAKFCLRVMDEDAFGRMQENEDFVSLVTSTYTTSYEEVVTIPATGPYYFVATLHNEALWAEVSLSIKVVGAT